MKVTGIFARDPAETRRLLAIVRGRHAGDPRVRTLGFPPEAPVIAALVVEGQNSAIQWTLRADGSFAILDGELYNAEELHRVPGLSNGNNADMLLDLYLSAGEDAMAQADMAASLTIWDPDQERLLVYRSRTGQVSCYYVQRPDGVLWSSDIKTLLSTDTNWAMNRLALDAFLACGYVPAPWTFIEGIHKIPAGHVLICKRGKTPTCQHLRPYHREPSRVLSDEQVIEELRHLITQALRRRYTAEVRTGVLLSGGIDSKLIVAALTKLLSIPGDTIDTFTFRYSDYEGKYNELEPARQAARHFGTRHHEITFQPSEVASNLDLMLRFFEEPFTYGLHSFMLGDVTKTGVRVILTGIDLGALSRLERYALSYARLPKVFQRAGRSLVPAMWLLSETLTNIRPRFISRVARGIAWRADGITWVGTNALPLHCAAMIIPDRLRGKLYCDKDFAAAARTAREALLSTAKSDFLNISSRERVLLLLERFFDAECIHHWYHAAARAHGLIFRHPFRDNALDRFVIRLPKHDIDKQEIRRFAVTLMPRELAYTPKIAQSVPIREWLRGPLQEFLRDNLSAESIKAQGLFDEKVVQHLIAEHVRGVAHHGWGLWAILTVMRWQELFLLGAHRSDVQNGQLAIG
jgi:asparagine synthase (glutamine-hydrolysing)